MPIRILIADDHQLFREGLTQLMADPAIEVVGYAENGKEAVSRSKELKPDIVIMDIGMKIMNGIEATQLLQKEQPNVKVIGLSMHADNNYIKAMLEAGAWGYLLKNCSYQQLMDALFSVFKGNKYLSDEITDIVINNYLTTQNHNHHHSSELTEREYDVLKQYGKGKSTREIADTLFISEKTVATHKQHILKKLDLKSSADLIKYALKNGIVSMD